MCLVSVYLAIVGKNAFLHTNEGLPPYVMSVSLLQ